MVDFFLSSLLGVIAWLWNRASPLGAGRSSEAAGTVVALCFTVQLLIRVSSREHVSDQR